MDKDTKEKKATFISRSTEARETFSFAHHTEILNAVKLYCCDHYGSMLWNFQGDLAHQVFNTWSTCIKLAWDLPRATCSYFLGCLSGGMVTVKWYIISRYAVFFKGLLSSPRGEVSILARLVAKDVTTARNLIVLRRQTVGQEWTSSARELRQELMKMTALVLSRKKESRASKSLKLLCEQM